MPLVATKSRSKKSKSKRSPKTKKSKNPKSPKKQTKFSSKHLLESNKIQKTIIPHQQSNIDDEEWERQFREKRLRKKEDAIKAKQDQEKKKTEKEKADKIELKRKEKIITPYIKKLEAKLVDNKFHIHNYFVWADKLTKKLPDDEITILNELKKNPKKYEGKKLALVSILFPYRKRHTPEGNILAHPDSWLKITIHVFTIEEEKVKKATHTFSGFKYYGGVVTWLTDDFKITKYSTKLLNFMIKALADEILSFPSVFGVDWEYVVDLFKKNKRPIPEEYLVPLAGV